MKVMIVDDAMFMRFLIKKILEPYGYEIIEAEDGETAIEKYKKFKPDIVTLDIIMPKMTGLETLKEIMKIDNRAKVIIVSAIMKEDVVLNAIACGAKDFIVKPIKEDIVKEAIEKILNKSKM